MSLTDNLVNSGLLKVGVSGKHCFCGAYRTVFLCKAVIPFKWCRCQRLLVFWSLVCAREGQAEARKIWDTNPKNVELLTGAGRDGARPLSIQLASPSKQTWISDLILVVCALVDSHGSNLCVCVGDSGVSVDASWWSPAVNLCKNIVNIIPLKCFKNSLGPGSTTDSLSLKEIRTTYSRILGLAPRFHQLRRQHQPWAHCYPFPWPCIHRRRCTQPLCQPTTAMNQSRIRGTYSSGMANLPT